jgi:acetylornithine/N-succinyldiaminopimelate aminotransferase
MVTNRQIFLNNVGQTSPTPLCLEIVKAKGCTMWDRDGKEYLDLIAGISVCNLGHCHPAVVNAVKEQAEQYMHLMVYGEFVESPQVKYAKLLTDNLPPQLNSVFYTASGTEATEGAMKLAKRYTGRTEICAFKNSYHGSTQGALSLLGNEYWRNAFRPLLPDVRHLDYNDIEQLEQISTQTACVIAETVQAEAGVNPASKEWLTALRKRCDEVGALLVLDEIQCGFGRNGTLWAFEQYGIVPDVLLLGKAMGGGMPLGAFISGKEIMDSLTERPVLGHINTFGGHPVCCGAGHAGMEVLLNENIIQDVFRKEQLFLELLQPLKVKSRGLMMAVEFADYAENKRVIDKLVERGVFTDWFLFASNCLRIAPPLTISDAEIEHAAKVIKEVAGS